MHFILTCIIGGFETILRRIFHRSKFFIEAQRFILHCCRRLRLLLPHRRLIILLFLQIHGSQNLLAACQPALVDAALFNRCTIILRGQHLAGNGADILNHNQYQHGLRKYREREQKVVELLDDVFRFGAVTVLEVTYTNQQLVQNAATDILQYLQQEKDGQRDFFVSFVLGVEFEPAQEAVGHAPEVNPQRDLQQVEYSEGDAPNEEALAFECLELNQSEYCRQPLGSLVYHKADNPHFHEVYGQCDSPENLLQGKISTRHLRFHNHEFEAKEQVAELARRQQRVDDWRYHEEFFGAFLGEVPVHVDGDYYYQDENLVKEHKLGPILHLDRIGFYVAPVNHEKSQQLHNPESNEAEPVELVLVTAHQQYLRPVFFYEGGRRRACQRITLSTLLFPNLSHIYHCSKILRKCLLN